MAGNVLGIPAGQMTVQDPLTLKCPRQTCATCTATCTAAGSASRDKDCISARTVKDELSTAGRRAGWPVRPPLLTPPKTSHLTVRGQTEATIHSSAVASGPDEPHFGRFQARIERSACVWGGIGAMVLACTHNMNIKMWSVSECSYHRYNPPGVTWCKCGYWWDNGYG